ncbi:hypothetical protein FACS189427_11560 [Planctomycetales bacterium]|nr:hypothetical protein FACS189427_11560 [Planctomycetales bacterium]
MINAVFDACILHSAPLRDILLRLAEEDLLMPFWTEHIHQEWMQNLLRNRPDLKRERVERTYRMLNEKFSDSTVHGYEPLIPKLTLPDENDTHVLAAAIKANVPLIITYNIKDFPQAELAQYALEAVTPDDCVMRIIDKHHTQFMKTVRKHRADLSRPPKTTEEYLATLEKQQLLKTADYLRKQQEFF